MPCLTDILIKKSKSRMPVYSCRVLKSSKARLLMKPGFAAFKRLIH